MTQIGAPGLLWIGIHQQRMLPVHAKIAALFMRGIPVREAVKRVQALHNLVPVQEQGQCQAFLDFMRVAVADNGHGTTTIVTLRTRVDHGSNAELYGWCTQRLNVWQNQYPATAPPPREESPRSVTTLTARGWRSTGALLAMHCHRKS